MSLYAGSLAPKEYDTIELSPPALPTKVVYKLAGVTLRTLTLKYEGATENLESVVVS